MDKLSQVNEFKEELSHINNIDDKPTLDALLPKIEVYLNTYKLQNKLKEFNDISFVPRGIDINRQTIVMMSLAFKNGIVELTSLLNSL